MALALVPAFLSACSADEAPEGPPPASASLSSPEVSASSSPTPVTRPSFPREDSGRTLAHLDDRTGSWKATLGKAGDKGSLSITVMCVGGGVITVSYRGAGGGAASMSPHCDGEQTGIQDEALAAGRVTVSVVPGGRQRWALDVTRDPRGD